MKLLLKELQNTAIVLLLQMHKWRCLLKVAIIKDLHAVQLHRQNKKLSVGY